jgi:hypothetical protein
MSQIALPLSPAALAPPRIVLGAANLAVVEALQASETWPYGTAVLTGPPRSGKSLLARWFAREGAPREVIDDAHRMDETALFHRWNRAQEDGTRLLLVAGEPPWRIRLPDLASRLGAALQLVIGAPDDAMAGELILAHAAARGLPLGEEAADYLVPRAGRSFAELERLVTMIDTLSLERKSAPTLGIWRAALEALYGPDEPRLL